MSNELILQYQKDPTNKEVAKQLLDLHADYIRSNVNKWKGPLPDAVLNAHGRNYALQAFKTYDPSKGANINTHLYNHLSQLSRLIYQHQNVANISENNIQQIGKVKSAQLFLTDELERDPTNSEIAEHLHMPIAHIDKILKSQRADFVNDSDAEVQQFDASQSNTEMSQRIFSYRQALTPLKREQFDLLTGYGNSQVISPQDFGKKFKLKPYEVSRLKMHFAKGLK